MRERLDEIPLPVRAGRLVPAAEVTLGESAAAHPEYADFHCATRLAAAGFCARLMGVRARACALFFSSLLLDEVSLLALRSQSPPPPHKTTAVRPRAPIQTGGRRVERFGI